MCLNGEDNPDIREEEWVFASESRTTPAGKDTLPLQFLAIAASPLIFFSARNQFTASSKLR